MKPSIQKVKSSKSTGSRVVMAFALASLISGLAISPAFADHDRGEGDGGDRHGGYEQRGHGHGHGHGHDDEDYQRSYYYARPVYVPAPVYYEPPRQSPGVSVFFPLDLRR